MRAAPPFSLRCCGGLPWRLLQTVLPALAAAASAAWLLGLAELPLAASSLAALVAAFLAWRHSVPHEVRLAWDGQRWTADDVPGRLDVMIDLGRFLLLRLQPEARGAARWIAVTALEAGPALHGLRAAVYSRPPETTPRALPPERAPD